MSEVDTIKNVTIVGIGTQWSMIAFRNALYGKNVTGYSRTQPSIDTCKNKIDKWLAHFIEEGKLTKDEAAELKQILDEFRLSINTSWAGILAVNLYFALSSGIEVTHALADLARSVEMARKINEYVKRENNEAKLMLKYLAPICYLLTAAGGIFFFNLSWRKFLLYQFQTAAGLTWFVVSLILYISGVIVFTYISRGKLDL